MEPKFDLEKIKFAVVEKTFSRAIGLYEKGKVKDFHEVMNGFAATVSGTHDYNVYISARDFSKGDCDCYMGQNDYLCKHMIAVAIRAVIGSRQLTDEEKHQHNELTFNGQVGEISKEEIVEIKKEITNAMRCIKAYEGPSRIWFQYQDSLTEGCNRLAAIFSKLPVGKTGTELIINTLLSLDKKLSSGGVDDSDGTVGGFIQSAVGLILRYLKSDPTIITVLTKLTEIRTCFGWEEPILEMIDEQNSLKEND